MMIPTLTTEPMALCHALKRIARRESRERLRARRPRLLHRVFPFLVPDVDRERVVAISPGEVITSNILQ